MYRLSNRHRLHVAAAAATRSQTPLALATEVAERQAAAAAAVEVKATHAVAVREMLDTLLTSGDSATGADPVGAFIKLDKDHSGGLDVQEFRRSLAEAKPPDWAPPALLSALDKDESGRVELGEFQRYVESGGLAQSRRRLGRGKSEARDTVKWVELLIVNDHEYARRMLARAGEDYITTMTLHALEVVNQVDAMFAVGKLSGFRHRIRVKLMGQHTFVDHDPWRLTWDYPSAEQSFQQLLAYMLEWRLAVVQRGAVPDHDNMILFSGHDLSAQQTPHGPGWSAMGYAAQGGMCRPHQSGSVLQVARPTDSAADAQGLARNLGHGFNMLDDALYEPCYTSDDGLEVCVLSDLGDGVCDAACNHAQCNYDQGDCWAQHGIELGVVMSPPNVSSI